LQRRRELLLVGFAAPEKSVNANDAKEGKKLGKPLDHCEESLAIGFKACEGV